MRVAETLSSRSQNRFHVSVEVQEGNKPDGRRPSPAREADRKRRLAIEGPGRLCRAEAKVSCIGHARERTRLQLADRAGIEMKAFQTMIRLMSARTVKPTAALVTAGAPEDATASQPASRTSPLSNHTHMQQVARCLRTLSGRLKNASGDGPNDSGISKRGSRWCRKRLFVHGSPAPRSVGISDARAGRASSTKAATAWPAGSA